MALRTRLVGYARWLEHGGKPEFFLLTKCDLSSDDIRRLRRTRDEDDLVGIVIAESLDADRLRLDPENPRLALPVTLRGSPSVPLLAALRAVGHGLATDPTLISG